MTSEIAIVNKRKMIRNKCNHVRQQDKGLQMRHFSAQIVIVEVYVEMRFALLACCVRAELKPLRP